jgi:hypothetical protein
MTMNIIRILIKPFFFKFDRSVYNNEQRTDRDEHLKYQFGVIG